MAGDNRPSRAPRRRAYDAGAANDYQEAYTPDHPVCRASDPRHYGERGRPISRVSVIRFKNARGSPILPLPGSYTGFHEEVDSMSIRDDATQACLNALRSRPWPPTTGELELLRRAAEIAEDEEAKAQYDRAFGAVTAKPTKAA
jgi:hypothetical protein